MAATEVAAIIVLTLNLPNQQMQNE